MIRFWAVMSVCVLAFAPPAAKPVALIHDVSGDVELIPADGKPRKCKPKQLIYLYEKDQLRVERQAKVTVGFLGDFHWEQLKPGEIRVTARACEPAELVERLDVPTHYRSKIAQKGLAAVSSGSGRGAGLVLRGGGPEGTKPLVTPVLGEAVASDKPALTWSPVSEVKRYQVSLFLGGSGRSLWTASTEKPRLDFPADQPALKRNRIYDWQVNLENADGTVTQVVRSRFTVVSEAVAEELRSLKPLAESSQPVDLLVAIAAYQIYNADGPALAGCEKLAKLTPSDPDVFRLLVDLYDRAGRAEDSKIAGAQADGPNASKNIIASNPLDPKNKITSKTLDPKHKITNFKGMTFSGEFANYDFSNVTFDSCEFVDCTFTRGSTFNGAVFKNSRFKSANFSLADTLAVKVFGERGDSRWKKDQEPTFKE